MPRRRLLLCAVLGAATLSSTSCTLCKPVVCAVTTPIFILGSGNFGGCRCDGEGALCALALASAVGAVGGLVTGFLSDLNYVRGYTTDPARNLHDPFATNTSASSW